MKSFLKRERFFILIILLTMVANLYTELMYLGTESNINQITLEEESRINQITDEELAVKAEKEPLKYSILYFLDTLVILAGLVLIVRGSVFYIRLLLRRMKRKSRIFFFRADDTWPLDLIPFLRAIILIFFFWSVLRLLQIGLYPFFKDSLFVFIFSLTIGFQVCGISAVIYYAYKNRQIFQNKAFFLRTLVRSFKIYVRVIPLFFLAQVVNIFVFSKLNIKPTPQEVVDIFLQQHNLLVSFLIVISAVVFAPLFEELFFRGLLFRIIRNKSSFFFSAFISSAIFSLAHSHLVSFLPIFVLGFVFAHTYEKTKNITLPIFLHSIHNTVVFLLIFLIKAHY